MAKNTNTFNVQYTKWTCYSMVVNECLPSKLEAGEKWSFQLRQIFLPSKTGELSSQSNVNWLVADPSPVHLNCAIQNWTSKNRKIHKIDSPAYVELFKSHICQLVVFTVHPCKQSIINDDVDFGFRLDEGTFPNMKNVHFNRHIRTSFKAPNEFKINYSFLICFSLSSFI